MEPLIHATGIGVNLNGRTILSGVDLSVSAGEIVTLIGPNGAGKTTLVRILLGLMRGTAGKVERSGNLTIGYMPQKLKLAENMPLTVKRFLQFTRTKLSEDCYSVISDVGVKHLLEQPMETLSGGEVQRVLLARALLRNPNLLVLDEPVQGVDITGQAALYSLISRIRDQYKCGVLMVSHDLHLVMATTDQVLCLNQHVCCAGHPESVSKHPAYLELFGEKVSEELAIYTHHHDHEHDIHGNVIGNGKHQHG